MSDQQPALAIGVTAARESLPELLNTLRCLLHAVRTHGGSADISLLINGNEALAAALVARLRESADELDLPAGTALHVDVLGMADKAHALNLFLHELAPVAACTVLMDGYVRLHARALVELEATLRHHPDALGATGLPRSGWSARRVAATLQRIGGLHGNLFALSAQAVQQMRHLGFRLPRGLYRVDAVLGAVLAMGLELQERRWAPQQRIRLAERAAWEAPTLKPWRWHDLQTYWRRRRRQQAGMLENAAIRHGLEVERRPLADLPPTVSGLVARWQATAQADAAALLARPALAQAWAEMRQREAELETPIPHERRLSLG